MAKVLGVKRNAVKGIVAGFSVFVSYEFPSAIVAEELRRAVAKISGVDEDDIEVKTATRPAASTRRLRTHTVDTKFTMDTEISVADAATAKATQTKTASIDTLKLALAKMGVDTEPFLKLPPLVAVKTEMRIITVGDSKLRSPRSADLAEVGAAVGGRVTITGGTLMSAATTTASAQVTSVSTTTSSTEVLLGIAGGAHPMKGLCVAMVALVLHMTWLCFVF